MISQYQHNFRQNKIIHKELYLKILNQFQNYDHHKYYNYDQLLSIFDQAIQHKCNRDVFQQLFNQSANRSKQTTISDVVQKYIENIETSKLCIMRDQFKKNQLQKQRKGQKVRNKTFIFLKLIQASIYTRFTKSPIFQYKIQPTELPIVTLANALNPLINHEYTLLMQQQSFQIIFYESGIEILRWSFPDEHDLKQGQYFRIIKSQNVSFEMKIKYMPKDQSKTKDSINIQITNLNNKINRQQQAFKKLCHFEPFLQRNNKIPINENEQNTSKLYIFTEHLFQFLPCLKDHLKILNLILMLTLLLQCFTSSFWPIQFLDICCCFYCLGVIYDRNIQNYHLKIIIMQIIFMLLILKSIWAGVYQPYTQKTKINKTILIFGSIFKAIIILILFITQIRRQEIPRLRQQLLYNRKQKINQKQDNYMKYKKQYQILE